jgi:CheY-like chemotaxis protein
VRASPFRARLLIDDEELLLQVWTRWLHRFGIEVWTARSARDAVSALDRFQGEFDAVACDLHMADGGGMELHRFLDAKYPGAEHRVVFIAGGAVSDRNREFLRVAGDPLQQKAVGPSEEARRRDE